MVMTKATQRDVWAKFFWADWRSDEALALCSYAARGVWMELLALMAKSERPGYLLVNGAPPDDRTLLMLTRGRRLGELRRAVDELKGNGVCSVEDGVLLSRRLVREAHRREVCRANGRQGGNPALVSRLVDDLDKPDNKHPSNTQKLEARSQRLEARKSTRAPDVSAGWEAFWTAYPRHVAKAPALRAWRKVNQQGALDGAILAGLERAKDSPTWRRNMAEPDMPHVPHASTWLNQRRWEDEAPRTASAGPSSNWIAECESAHGGTCHTARDHFARLEAS